jgi:hypothetical protein
MPPRLPRVLLSPAAAVVLGTLHMQAVLAVALLVVMVCRIRVNRIAAVWVARKVLVMRWVSEVLEEQTVAAVAVAIGVAMAQVKVDNQMVGVLLLTLVVAVVQVGQLPTLCLQRIRKVSAQVTGCSPLPLHKTQRSPLRLTLLQMVGTLVFMFHGLLQLIRKLRVIASSGALRLVRSPMWSTFLVGMCRNIRISTALWARATSIPSLLCSQI